MNPQLVGAFGCLNILTAPKETDVGSSGPGSSPWSSSFTSMIFSYTLSNKQSWKCRGACTVLITASGSDNSNVYQGSDSKRTVSCPRVSCMFTMLTYHCLSAWLCPSSNPQVINVSDGGETNNVLPVVEFCYSFLWSPMLNYIAHKALCVYIFTL